MHRYKEMFNVAGNKRNEAQGPNRETQREREHGRGEWERERRASHRAGRLMWGLIPGPWDLDLS